MAKKTSNTNNTEVAPEVAIQSAIGRTEDFLYKNGRTLLIILGVIVLVIGGFFAYKYLVQAPQSKKAAEMMYVAQQHFAADSLKLALEGDGNFEGFLGVIEKYGSTPEGNLAQHYAGISYLYLGEYQKALDHLKKYTAVEGIPGQIVNAQNIGLQGDAYVQMENLAEAVKMYEKAVSVSDNSLTAPYYLKKAGSVYEKLGDKAKAIEAYKRISADYATSMEARDIQKYIGALEQQL